MRRLRLVLCALGFAILWGTVVSLAGSASEESAAKPEPEKKAVKAAGPPVPRTGVEAIEAALAKPITCEFVETPLKDVLDYMQDAMHVQIYLDSSGLKEAGVDESTPVTCNLRGLRFEKALNPILDSLQLKWTIHDDVLYVTSPTKLESEEFHETRVYDAGDLVVYQDENGKKFDDYAPLSDVITQTIDPKTWSDSGSGTGSILGESLGTAKVVVVTNRYDVHKKIAALLADIRTIAAKKTGGGDLPRRERPKAPAVLSASGPVGPTKDFIPPSKPAKPPVKK